MSRISEIIEAASRNPILSVGGEEHHAQVMELIQQLVKDCLQAMVEQSMFPQFCEKKISREYIQARGVESFEKEIGYHKTIMFRDIIDKIIEHDTSNNLHTFKRRDTEHGVVLTAHIVIGKIPH